MRKFFFATMIAMNFLWIQGHATVTVALYPAILDSVSWNTASLTSDISGNINSYKQYYNYQPTGDTVHTGPGASFNSATLQRVLGSLSPNTTYQVWSVVINNGDTVTSAPISFTTKSLPHSAWITNAVITSTPSQTSVGFTYNVSVPTKFFVKYGSYVFLSDTVIVNGTGTAQLLITHPNIPGTTYSGNILRAISVTTGLAGDTFINLGAFTVPIWTNPDVANNLVFSAVTQDSFNFSATFTKGNSATAMVTVRDLDSNGIVVATRTLIIIHNDTTINWTRTGIPATNYGERVVVSTSGGSDSTTAFKATLQVPAPQVVSFDTVNTTKSSTDITVIVATNGKSAWVTSNALVWIKWFDKNGVATTTTAQSIPGSSAIATLTFTGLTNLNTNPNSNLLWIYIKNLAGLVDSQQFFYTLTPLVPAVPISSGWYIEAISSYEIGISNINAGPSTGLYDLYAFVNIIQSGLVDTILLRPNQLGYTYFSKKDTIGGRLGSTNYMVRLATRNSDGVWLVSNNQTIQTIPAALPTFFLSSSYIATTTSLTYKVMGCGNGTSTYLDVQAFLPGSSTPAVSQALGYQGTGNFSISGTLTGLLQCTTYTVKALVHDGSYGNQITDDKSRVTLCNPSGVQEIEKEIVKIFPNPVFDKVVITRGESLGVLNIFSSDGRKIFSQNFSENTTIISLNDLPAGIYFLQGKDFQTKFIKE